MILVSYETTNWGPHRHLKLVFPQGAKTIALCAPNDEGKSWAVRGIGFCLSIGRNEYGDQSSIHDGEAESSHTLVVEHNGKKHTIEKIVRGKKSEDEGTQTFINGEQADRASYEEFYSSTLGLPHPSIWLPIIIAMQNETDFHLRRKKSEREEALRAACQLTRIDSWKEALQARTNEEDKEIIALSASQKTQLEGLRKELTLDKETLIRLKSEELALRLPLGESGPSLEKILESVASYNAAKGSLKKARLEEENKRREQELAESSHGRLTSEIATIPGASPEEETQCVAKLESLEEETQAREKGALETKLGKTMRGAGAKNKEMRALPKAQESTAEEIERACASLEACEKTLGEKREAMGRIFPTTENQAIDSEELHSQTNTARKLRDESEKRRSAIADQKKTLEAALGQATKAWPAASGLQPEAALGSAEAELEACFEFGYGPLGKAEAELITLRVLENWEEHPHEECPICSRGLTTLPIFSDERKRKILVQGLKEEARTGAQETERRKALTLACSHLHNACNAKKALQDLDAWEDTAGTIKTLSATIEGASKKTALYEEAAVLAGELKTFDEKIAAAKKSLNAIDAACTDITAARAHASAIRKSLSAKAVLSVEIHALEQICEEINVRLENLAGAQAPSQKWESNDDIAIKTLLESTKEIAKTMRIHRTKRAEKEKELAAATAKREAICEGMKALLATIKEIEGIIETGSGLPKGPSGGPDEWTEHWAETGRKLEATRGQIEPVQTRITTRTQEEETAAKECEKTELRAAKAAAARKLIAFLDYKNAPRKLLESICQKLFEATNRLAEVLQADIRLKVGKNLDFLTLQHRAGRLIEQKTERLGFGKGAILGICFRLACQKLLLPETGFLILDEPTANVDTKRKGALKIFLQNLGEETESKTKQIVMIEHDADVVELCQAKIMIGENK